MTKDDFVNGVYQKIGPSIIPGMVEVTTWYDLNDPMCPVVVLGDLRRADWISPNDHLGAVEKG